MKTGRLNIDLIHKNAPRSWGEFLEFYKNEIKEYPAILTLDFTSLPFEFQLGVFLKYFKGSSIDLDVSNQDFADLLDYIPVAFKIHEGVSSHYS